jgi:PKD repeat protein
VSLTVSNVDGSDTETKVGYVTVTEPTQTTFYVYAEGVGMYHGTQADLSLGNQTHGYFYNFLNGRCGTVDTEKCWYGHGIYTDDSAGSVHWSAAEQASSYADNADFSVFVGHGSNESIVFGTQNSSLELSRSNMQFGSNRAKWVTFFACDVLNESTQTNWETMFNGVHIVNGFDTDGLLYDGQGTKNAQMLTGIGGGYDRKSIRVAWRLMLQETIDKDYIKGAYMWADPCGDDYLPGFGNYCASPPTKNENGNYDITWRNFNCTIS